MTVRQFDGSDDGMACEPGAGATMAAAPFTVAVLVKRNETDLTPLMGFVANATASSNTFGGPQHQLRYQATANNNAYVQVAADAVPTLPVVNADNWVLMVCSKASGTTAPRFHRYVLGTATMTRANSSSSQANGLTPAGTYRWIFGKDEFTNKGALYLATAACWNVVLSDGQVDEIATALSTQSMYDNTAGVPVALWDFNQAAVGTAVTDLTGGGADQSSIVGTTAVAGNDPPGWTFGLAPSQQIRPDSDLDVATWTTAPLAAKVSDESDATVIRAPLA